MYFPDALILDEDDESYLENASPAECRRRIERLAEEQGVDLYEEEERANETATLREDPPWAVAGVCMV